MRPGVRRASSLSMSRGRTSMPVTAGIQADSILGEKLHIFEAEKFDAESFIQEECKNMSERGIRQLVLELAEHKRASAEEMRKAVSSHFTSFIRTAQEISDLEVQLREMRVLLSSQVSLIHNLAGDGPTLGPMTVASEHELEEEAAELYAGEVVQSELARDADALPDLLDAYLAERNLEQALRLLEQGQDLLVYSRHLLQNGQVEEGQLALDLAAMETLERALTERRVRLAESLADTIRQPSVRGSELRTAVSALVKLQDAPWAHTLLLGSHSDRLRRQVSDLRPGGTSYGGAYATALSQLVFSTIARAARDSTRIFGEQPVHASELMLWAQGETVWCASLLLRHVLSSAAAAGGLRTAAECVQISLGHCALLEEQGLALTPVLMRLVRPSVEKALEANVDRIRDSISAMANVDNWSLHYPPSAAPRYGRAAAGGSGTNLRLTSSAHRLFTMLQEFVDDVVPMSAMQLTLPTLDGVARLYEQYIETLRSALQLDDPGQWDGNTASGPDGIPSPPPVQRAIDERQQLALVCNATTLAEELPRVAQRLMQGPPVAAGSLSREGSRLSRDRSERTSIGAADAKKGQMQQWKRHLQRSVESLRLELASQRATQLLYPEETAILPYLYFGMDSPGDPISWLQNSPMPTEPMQGFFWTSLAISRTGGEILAGRERLVLQLLTQLSICTLTLLITSKTWDDERYILGPTGLSQFLLDVVFVKEVAQKYHYSSRQMLQVAEQGMERVKHTFDPNGEAPEDAVLVELAQDAITRLLHGGGPENTGTVSDMTSPRSTTSFVGSEDSR